MQRKESPSASFISCEFRIIERKKKNNIEILPLHCLVLLAKTNHCGMIGPHPEDWAPGEMRNSLFKCVCLSSRTASPMSPITQVRSPNRMVLHRMVTHSQTNSNTWASPRLINQIRLFQVPI